MKDIVEKLAMVDAIVAEVTTTANVASYPKSWVNTGGPDDEEEKKKKKELAKAVTDLPLKY